MNNPFDLAGAVIVVTGASSGIGAHITQMLANQGATVVAAARRLDRLADLEAGSSNIHTVGADVAVAADRAELMAVAEALGGPDVLINNAGFGHAEDSLTVAQSDFDRCIEVNLSASFALSQLAARAMIGRNDGAIISVASIYGLVAAAPIAHAAYAAAKGGLVNLTRQLGCEWARHGVRVNAIAPGWFRTEATAAAIDDPRQRSFVERNTPLGRVGELSELDGAVMLLASSAGSFITGQTLVVDGGWSAR